MPGKVIGIYVMLSTANIGAWTWAISSFQNALVEG